MLHIDYHGHPKKPLRQLLYEYSSSMLILDDVLATEESYQYVYQDILDLLKYAMEVKYVREMPINFIIHRPDKGEESKIETLEARHFLSNMVLWYAFLKMDRVEIMDSSYIVDWRGKSVNFIGTYVNEKIIPNYEGDFHSLNAICDEIVHQVKAISDAFCMIFGYSASIYDIMKAEENNPRIHEILYSHIDSTMQPREMEHYLAELNKELMDAFAKADSDLTPLLLSGKNLSENQCKEIFLRIGYKADISNRTIPYFIDSNLLITGIDTPAAFYIIAGSGRGALMNTKLAMAKPGAMSKKMNHSATPIVLRQDHEWCNSTRPIYYHIKNEDFLSMLDKRYYYDEEGKIQLLDANRDKHLIGKTFGFRSPCTCNSKHGICEGCYGDLFDMNSDLFSQGSLAATMDSEPTGQLVLSQKHTQNTDSSEIDFDKEFYENFDIVSTEITMGDNIDDQLWIQLGPVTTEETDNGDAYFVKYFDLVDFNGELKAHIKEQNDYNMYLSNEMVAAWKACKDNPIPVARFDYDDDSTVLFNIEVTSKAITEGLQMITAALDSKDHLGCSHDIDGLCNKFGQIMLDANIKYNFVHHEMILRSLMRKADNDLEYPEFGPNDDHENYTILRLTSSLSRSPSPMIRLSTGWLKKSLISTALYKANMPSHLDALFVPILADVI